MNYENRRVELLSNLRLLADPARQKKYWVDHNFEDGQLSFSDTFHFFFDDTSISEDATECIGEFLRNADEAAHATAVARALEALVDAYDSFLEGDEYITKPEWQAVVDTARAALAVVSDPEPKTHASVRALAALWKSKQDGPPYATTKAAAIIREGYLARETEPGYFDSAAWREKLAIAQAELAATPDEPSR